MFRSHEAQDMPPNGFLVNMASSSLSLYPPLFINISKMLFTYLMLILIIILTFLSKLVNLLRVSLLSAKLAISFLIISFILSIILASKSSKSYLSAFLLI